MKKNGHGFKYKIVMEQVLQEAKKTNNFRLPSEREISKQYNVSRNTSRNALRLLHDMDVVTREVGRGTYLISSKVKRQLCLIIPPVTEDLKAHFKNEVALFTGKNPQFDIKIAQVDKSEFMSFAKSEPRTKIVFGSHFGYLSSIKMLSPLNKIPGFYDSLSQVNSQFIRWHSNGDKKSYCYSFPLFANVDVMGFNQEYAEQLGLDAEVGPQSFDEILEWLRVVDEKRMEVNFKGGMVSKAHPMLPDTFYANLNKGLYFLQIKDGKPSFDFSAGKEWLSFFRKIYSFNNSYRPERLEMSPLARGKILLDYKVGTWVISQQKQFGNLPLKICSVPPVKKSGESFSRISTRSFGLVEDGTLDDDYRKAAWELISFLCCDVESQERLINNFSGIAINQEVFQKQTRDSVWFPFIKNLSSGFMISDHHLMQEVRTVMVKYFYQAVWGMLSVDEAVEKIEEMCQLLIQVDKERNFI